MQAHAEMDFVQTILVTTYSSDLTLVTTTILGYNYQQVLWFEIYWARRQFSSPKLVHSNDAELTGNIIIQRAF